MTPDGWLKLFVCVHAAICNPTASSTFASSCVGLMQPHHDTVEVSHWMVLAVSALEICQVISISDKLQVCFDIVVLEKAISFKALLLQLKGEVLLRKQVHRYTATQ